MLAEAFCEGALLELASILSRSAGATANGSTAGLPTFFPLVQCSSDGLEKKTNSGVVHTIIEPSAATSSEVTGPGMPSSTHDAFSDCMIASYSATPPSVRPRARLPARVWAWHVNV